MKDKPESHPKMKIIMTENIDWSCGYTIIISNLDSEEVAVLREEIKNVIGYLEAEEEHRVFKEV